MEIRQPRVTALFDASIAELNGAGISPTPRECVWLHALCEAQVRPDKCEVTDWLAPAIRLGKLTLYPVTVQARLWLDGFAAKWWADDDLYDVLGTAWALAHACEEGAFAGDMAVRWKAQIRIGWWAARLPYTTAQITEALKRYFGGDSYVSMGSGVEPAADANPFEWGEVLARAVAISGTAPAEVMLWTETQLFDVLGSQKKLAAGQVDPSATRAREALRLAKLKIKQDHAAK